jgi:3-oxoadipate enol-lactonase
MADSGFITIPEGQIFWEFTPSASATSRPVLVFFHAGIADHTLWDSQVDYFTAKGWNVLTFDNLGFGRSKVAHEWLGKVSEMKVEFFKIPSQVWDAVLSKHPAVSKSAVSIGCSMGGGHALNFAIERPDLVKGLVSIAGVVPGLDIDMTLHPEEEELLNYEFALGKAKDVEGIANFFVRYWGDGPLQKEGRISPAVKEKMYTWGKAIAADQVAQNGGMRVGSQPLKPSAGTRLADLKIPVAAVLGIYDESECQAAMRALAAGVPNGVCKEFPAAHLPSLELPGEFNAWLEDWLNKYLT